VGRAALFAGVFIAARRGAGLVGVMIALSAGNFSMVALTWLFARRLARFSLGFDWRLVKEIIGRSWPIALSTVFNLVYLRGDVMTMKIVGRPDAEIGWYGAAYKPLDVITVIPVIFMGLVLPLFVNAWKSGDRERIDRIVLRAVDAVSLLAFPTLVGGIILATPLMIFISGPEFAPSGPLLALLIIAAFMVFFGSLFGHLIVGVNRQRAMLWIYAVDAAVSLGLYALTIPRYGAVAAALVTIFSEAVIAIAAGIIVVRETRTKIIFYNNAKALVAALGMGAMIALVPSWNVLIRIALGAAVYGALLLAFKAVKKDEVSLLVKGL